MFDSTKVNAELKNMIGVAMWTQQSHSSYLLLTTRRLYIQVCLFGSLEKQTIFMASLLTLPVHLLYRILDELEPVEIFMSVRNVCSRLNLVTDSYHPYQVSSGSLS